MSGLEAPNRFLVKTSNFVHLGLRYLTEYTG